MRAARLPARALPLRTQAKMEPMEASIASTAAPWAELLGLDRARARHVTYGGITVWQLEPSYPASHPVHVHDPVVPPTVPPLMQ